MEVWGKYNASHTVLDFFAQKRHGYVQIFGTIIDARQMWQCRSTRFGSFITSITIVIVAVGVCVGIPILTTGFLCVVAVHNNTQNVCIDSFQVFLAQLGALDGGNAGRTISNTPSDTRLITAASVTTETGGVSMIT